MTSPSTFNVTHTMSEENRDYPPEQSQQCPASCPPSLQHHPIPTNSPSSSGHKVSSGGCDGTNTNSSVGATDSTAHPSFGHPSPVSLSQSNTVQAAHGTILRQDLQYSGTDTTDSGTHSPGDPEASSVLAGAASGSHLNTECTTDSVSYFLTYPEAGGVFAGEAFDMCFDSGAAADTVNRIHHYDPS